MKAKNKLISKRKMTDDDKKYLDELFRKEKIRYDKSKSCGGIDSKNNYTALHHR